MTDAERIYQLMVITARADDTVDPREAKAIAAIVGDTPDLQRLPDRGGLARAARELLDAKGLAAAVREVAAPIAGDDARKLAVRCCTRVLAADGVVARAELELIGQLRRAFGYTLAFFPPSRKGRPGDCRSSLPCWLCAE